MVVSLLSSRSSFWNGISSCDCRQAFVTTSLLLLLQSRRVEEWAREHGVAYELLADMRRPVTVLKKELL